MVRDQAAELRNLVRAARGRATWAPAPALLAVAGGKAGVGTTTLAVNLALALAELGPRVVLADANLLHANVAALCGIDEQATIADVLAARRDVHEVLRPGPGGIQVLPGTAVVPEDPVRDDAWERFIHQLRALGRHAETVLLDVGAAANPHARQIWRAADSVLVVTTTDDNALMDCYAAIKTLGSAGEASIHIVVNQAMAANEADDVFARLTQSCERFLGKQISLAGWLPSDPAVAAAGKFAIPFLVRAPECPAAAALEMIAQTMQPHLERKTMLGSARHAPEQI